MAKNKHILSSRDSKQGRSPYAKAHARCTCAVLSGSLPKAGAGFVIAGQQREVFRRCSLCAPAATPSVSLPPAVCLIGTLSGAETFIALK